MEAIELISWIRFKRTVEGYHSTVYAVVSGYWRRLSTGTLLINFLGLTLQLCRKLRTRARSLPDKAVYRDEEKHVINCLLGFIAQNGHSSLLIRIDSNKPAG